MWNPFRKKESQIITGSYEYTQDFVDQEQENREVVNEEPIESEIISELRQEEEIIDVIQEEFLLVEDSWTIRLRKIIRLLILVMVVLVPVFFTTLTAPFDVLGFNKQLLVYGLIFLAFILWLVMIIRQGGAIIRRSGYEVGILALVLAWLVASIFSIEPGQSFLAQTGFIVLTSLVLFYFLLINFYEKSDIQKVINYFLLGMFLAISTGLLHAFNVPVFKLLNLFSYKDFSVSSYFNTVGTVNSMGALAALAFVFTVSQYFNLLHVFNSKDEPYQKHFGLGKIIWQTIQACLLIESALLLLILNWWALYLAISIGMLVVIVTPGILSIITRSKFKVRTINIMGPLIIVVLSILLIFGGKNLNFGSLVNGRLVPEIDLSSKSTFEITKKVINDSPVFGFGLDSFRFAFDAYKPADLNQTQFWNIRFNSGSSELFDLIVSGGLALLVGLIILLFYLFRKVLSLDNSNPYYWMILPTFVASLTIFVLYPFNFVLYFVFWLLISLMAVLVRNERQDLKVKINDTSLASIFSSLIFVLVLSGCLVGGYLMVQKYRGDFYFAQAARLDLSKKESLDKAIVLVNEAIDSNSDVKYLTGLSQLLTFRINLELNNTSDKKEDVNKKLQSLTKSIAAVVNQMTTDFKNDSTSWLSAASVYEGLIGSVTGADDAAAEAYGEYLKRSPFDPAGYVKLGNVYLNRAERDRNALIDAKSKKLNIKNEQEVVSLILDSYNKAEANLKQAINLKDDESDAVYNLGVIYERENRIKEAIKQLETTRVRDFNNPGLALELGLLYYRDNQKDKAFNEVLRSLSLFKDYSNARWYLALMLEEQGRMDLAIDQLKEILKLDVNKDNPTVLQKIASLEAGKREIPPAKVTSKKPLQSKKLQ